MVERLALGKEGWATSVNLEGFAGSAVSTSPGAHVHISQLMLQDPTFSLPSPWLPHNTRTLAECISQGSLGKQNQEIERERLTERARDCITTNWLAITEKEKSHHLLSTGWRPRKISCLIQSPKAWEAGKPRAGDQCPSWSNQEKRGGFLLFHNRTLCSVQAPDRWDSVHPHSHRERATYFTDSTNSNANLVQKRPHRVTQK